MRTAVSRVILIKDIQENCVPKHEKFGRRTNKSQNFKSEINVKAPQVYQGKNVNSILFYYSIAGIIVKKSL